MVLTVFILFYACALSHGWLCDPMHCGPPGSSIHGIFQATILERVATSCPRESSWPWDRTHISYVSWTDRFFPTAPPVLSYLILIRIILVCFHWILFKIFNTTFPMPILISYVKKKEVKRLTFLRPQNLFSFSLHVLAPNPMEPMSSSKTIYILIRNRNSIS